MQNQSCNYNRTETNIQTAQLPQLSLELQISIEYMCISRNNV